MSIVYAPKAIGLEQSSQTAHVYGHRTDQDPVGHNPRLVVLGDVYRLTWSKYRSANVLTAGPYN